MNPHTESEPTSLRSKLIQILPDLWQITDEGLQVNELTQKTSRITRNAVDTDKS